MINRILVATDGSPHAGRALTLATDLAKGVGAGLSIAHVLLHGRPSPELQRMAEVEHMISHARASSDGARGDVPVTMVDVLREADKAARMSAVITAIGEKVLGDAKRYAVSVGIDDVTTHMCAGDVADEILEVAEADDVDMIVVGCRGLGRLRSAVLGSVSHKVAQHAPCSVTIVK